MHAFFPNSTSVSLSAPSVFHFKSHSFDWLFKPISHSIISRFLSLFLFLLQGIFSEIDLEGDAENELKQTEWLQSKQSGKKPSLILHISECLI